MKQKLIFLDIDGTLLPPGEITVPARAVEAIRQARANGHKVFPVSYTHLDLYKRQSLWWAMVWTTMRNTAICPMWVC